MTEEARAVLIELASSFDMSLVFLAAAIARAKDPDEKYVTAHDVRQAYDYLVVTNSRSNFFKKTALAIGAVMMGLFLSQGAESIAAGTFTISLVYVAIALVGTFLVFWGST